MALAALKDASRAEPGPDGRIPRFPYCVANGQLLPSQQANHARQLADLALQPGRTGSRIPHGAIGCHASRSARAHPDTACQRADHTGRAGCSAQHAGCRNANANSAGRTR